MNIARYTYRQLASNIVFLIFFIWLSWHWNWYWHLLAAGLGVHCLRNAAYASPRAQPEPQDPWAKLGLIFHKLLAPVAVPFARLEVSFQEAFFRRAERKSTPSLLSAAAAELRWGRIRQMEALGMRVPADAAPPLHPEVPEDESLPGLPGMDRNSFSRLWPYASFLYAFVFRFILLMQTLTYRISGEDQTRRETWNPPVPVWVGDYRQGEIERSFDDVELRESTSIGWNPALRDMQRAFLANFLEERYAECLAAVLAAQRLLDDLRQEALGGSPRTSRNDYLLNSAFWVGMALSLVPRFHRPDEEDLLRLYEGLVRAKAAEIDVLSVRKQVVQQAPPQTRRLWRRILPSLDEWVDAAMRPSITREGCDSKGYSLRTREDIADAYLGFAMGMGAISARIDKIDWSAIVGALGDGEALIDYYRYSPLDIAYLCESEFGDYGADRYFAFVLDRGGISYADLGPAESIDRLIRGHLGTSSAFGFGSEHDFSGGLAAEEEAAATLLWRKLVAPFSDRLRGARRIHVSPDAEISRLSFSALRLRDGSRLIDHHEISYLESARRLAQKAETEDSHPGAPLVLGAPDFGPALADGEAGFDYLDGTALEAEGVARILGVSALTGARATEQILLSASRPVIIHLASHGYYLESPDPPDSGEPLPPPATRWDAIRSLRNPLLRSGVALAGANLWLASGTSPPGGKDGLLTAEDVLEMDLAGTELVVLSACETGVGETPNGQGVVGLRRSFAVAGARTIVASLWKVPDEPTRRLMLSFYSNLARGLGKAAALLEAQQALRKSFPEVFYWAGFVCVGDTCSLPASIIPVGAAALANLDEFPSADDLQP